MVAAKIQHANFLLNGGCRNLINIHGIMDSHRISACYTHKKKKKSCEHILKLCLHLSWLATLFYPGKKRIADRNLMDFFCSDEGAEKWNSSCEGSILRWTPVSPDKTPTTYNGIRQVSVVSIILTLQSSAAIPPFKYGGICDRAQVNKSKKKKKKT